MKVLLEIGGTRFVLPYVKSIDELLAMVKDAQPVRHQSESGYDNDRNYVYDSAYVMERRSDVEVHVLPNDGVCTLEEWKKRAEAMAAKILKEEQQVRAVES